MKGTPDRRKKEFYVALDIACWAAKLFPARYATR